MGHSKTLNLHTLVCLAAAVVAAALIEPVCSGERHADSIPVRRATALSRPVRTGRLTQATLTESSGLVAGRKYPGVYWSMNDSGHPPVLYAVDATGKGLYSVRLTGARNIDWEDIAGDAAGMLYIGDFGDNARRRKVLTIYAVGEPDPKGKVKAVAVKGKCRFRYPTGHGPFDCEAMFVRKGWAYLITKETPRARLYRVRLATGEEEIVRADYLGPMPQARWVTAADVSPDGRRIAVLSYTGVWVYQLDKPLEKVIAAARTATRATTRTATSHPFQAIRARPLYRGVSLRQAEAVCWESGLSPAALLITNEQRDVYRMALISPPATQPAAR